MAPRERPTPYGRFFAFAALGQVLQLDRRSTQLAQPIFIDAQTRRDLDAQRMIGNLFRARKDGAQRRLVLVAMPRAAARRTARRIGEGGVTIQRPRQRVCVMEFGGGLHVIDLGVVPRAGERVLIRVDAVDASSRSERAGDRDRIGSDAGAEIDHTRAIRETRGPMASQRLRGSLLVPGVREEHLVGARELSGCDGSTTRERRRERRSSTRRIGPLARDRRRCSRARLREGAQLCQQRLTRRGRKPFIGTHRCEPAICGSLGARYAHHVQAASGGQQLGSRRRGG